MERTESTVIQVAPDFENAKIQEMQSFGWSLQGRQEMHQEGDAYGAPSAFGNKYIIKTTVHHYVKLHFVRGLDVPNLDKIKALETEYFNLPFPALPPLKGPGILTALGVVAVLVGVTSLGKPNFSPTYLIMYFVILAAGVLWLRSRLANRQQAMHVCTGSGARMEAIRSELGPLVT